MQFIIIMGKIIDGKAISAALYEQMRQEVEQLEQQYGRRPGLTVIIVGEDPASQVYVRNKEINAKKVGLVWPWTAFSCSFRFRNRSTRMP